MRILMWIVGGLAAGGLTGLSVRGLEAALIGDLVVGLLGGLVGGWLLGQVNVGGGANWLGQMLIAALGGFVLVIVTRAPRHKQAL